MCIFLCFCDSCLCFAVICQKLSKGVMKLYFFESNLFIWNRYIVFTKAYIRNVFSRSSVKTGKFICTESSCDLSCTVRTEIKENNTVLILNRCNRCAVLTDHRRQNKFVCLFCCIRCSDCLDRAVCTNAFAKRKGFISSFHSIPAVVSVHDIITAANRCDFSDADFLHLLFQFCDKTFSGGGRSISSV